jgi:hypothetical protein
MDPQPVRPLCTAGRQLGGQLRGDESIHSSANAPRVILWSLAGRLARSRSLTAEALARALRSAAAHRVSPAPPVLVCGTPRPAVHDQRFQDALLGALARHGRAARIRPRIPRPTYQGLARHLGPNFAVQLSSRATMRKVSEHAVRASATQSEEPSGRAIPSGGGVRGRALGRTLAIGHFQRNFIASSCFSVSRIASRTSMSAAEISKSSSAFCRMCGVLVALGSTTAPFCSR